MGGGGLFGALVEKEEGGGRQRTRREPKNAGEIKGGFHSLQIQLLGERKATFHAARGESGGGGLGGEVIKAQTETLRVPYGKIEE